MPRQRVLVLIMAAALVAGCATVPTGGYYGDVSELGTPGEVLAKISIGEGLLVETVSLDGGRTVNLQINREEVPKGEALSPDVLTIGKFSTILGSGFTGRDNIYFRKRIGFQGQDVFEVDGRNYLVTWHCNYRNPLTWVVADIYTITIQRLYRQEEMTPATGE